MPGQRASVSEELYEDTAPVRQDSRQDAEDLYEDTAAITHAGKGGGSGVKARALYDYQAGEYNDPRLSDTGRSYTIKRRVYVFVCLFVLSVW